jgi:hypothetical protein
MALSLGQFLGHTGRLFVSFQMLKQCLARRSSGSPSRAGSRLSTASFVREPLGRPWLRFRTQRDGEMIPRQTRRSGQRLGSTE